MEPLTATIDFMSTIRIALWTAIPLAVLMMLIFYLRKSQDKQLEIKQDPLEKEIFEKSMKRIAEEKLKSREQEPEQEEQVKLTPEEIRQKLEEAHKEFDEFELVEPLKDLEEESEPESEPDSQEKKKDD